MPDQSQITNAIAQGVQQNDGSSNPGNAAPSPQSDPMAQFDPTPSLIGRIIMGSAAHNNYLSQRLEGKQREELMAKEMQFKVSAAKKQAELQTFDAIVSQGGSKAFNSPEVQKFFHKDPDLYDAYKQKAQLVDVMHQAIPALAKSLGINPAMLQLDPAQAKVVEAQQKNSLTARGQDMRMAEAKMGQDAAMARTQYVQGQENARTAAQIASRTNLAGSDKQQARFDKWADDLGKQRDALISKYAATDTNGKQKFTDKQRKAAADAFNASVDERFKAFKEQGITGGDPEAYKLDTSPSESGSYYPWNWKKAEPGTLEPKVPTTVPDTGVAAAGHALKKPPFAGAIRTTYDGKPGWRDAKKTRFIPDA